MRLQLFNFYCIIKIAKVLQNATKGIFNVKIVAQAIANRGVYAKQIV